MAVSRLLQKSRVRPAWRVCTILRSPSESAKVLRRRNYLDDSFDNIFAKEHFEIWISSPYIDKDISLAIAMIENLTVHTFAFKKTLATAVGLPMSRKQQVNVKSRLSCGLLKGNRRLFSFCKNRQTSVLSKLSGTFSVRISDCCFPHVDEDCFGQRALGSSPGHTGRWRCLTYGMQARGMFK